MQLTDTEQMQVIRINLKIPLVHESDPECAIFGASKWRYRWPSPASEKMLLDWEGKHKVILPREYRIFLRYIANGGPGLGYGLFPLGETLIEGDLCQESTITPDMSQQDVETLHARQQVIYDVDDDVDTLLFYDGLISVLTQGCGYDICLVITGKYRGRLLHTDCNLTHPFSFISEPDFLTWYERWLDDMLGHDLTERCNSQSVRRLRC
ncbi:SMI1/KNR4 family protein (plasmid) [Serratia marcescens]|uniref:SMI1/KNR4 family protein n=1 Tax=Serratia marcescens TaxID=615 RepID=UPI0015D6E40B|nr:SMI1/KNR4 family protein [Serratia marcescens]QLJ63734.1 SMI1/KNR4 family protein [Serratia marcescens]